MRSARLPHGISYCVRPAGCGLAVWATRSKQRKKDSSSAEPQMHSSTEHYWVRLLQSRLGNAVSGLLLLQVPSVCEPNSPLSRNATVTDAGSFETAESFLRELGGKGSGDTRRGCSLIARRQHLARGSMLPVITIDKDAAPQFKIDECQQMVCMVCLPGMVSGDDALYRLRIKESAFVD